MLALVDNVVQIESLLILCDKGYGDRVRNFWRSAAEFRQAGLSSVYIGKDFVAFWAVARIGVDAIHTLSNPTRVRPAVVEVSTCELVCRVVLSHA
jgi:hypothetical protein